MITKTKTQKNKIYVHFLIIGILISSFIFTAAKTITVNTSTKTISRVDDSQAATSITNSNLNIAVVLINFQNTPALTTSSAKASQIMQQVAKYYQEASYGKVSVSYHLFDNYQMPVNQTCDTAEIFKDTIQVTDPTIDYRPFNNIIIVTALGETCAGSSHGIAPGVLTANTQEGQIPLATVIVDSEVPSPESTWTHEIGHNLNLHHANFLDCGNDSLNPSNGGTLPPGCIEREYEDLYDLMGGRFNWQFNAPHKDSLGWFSPANILTVSQSGTYTLEPIETATQGIKALKILRNNATELNKYLYIEYRQPIGFDATVPPTTDSSVYNGALLHLGNNGFSMLLDPHPPADPFLTTTLQVGETFTDPDSNAQIKVIAKTNADLTVQVTISTSPSTTPSTKYGCANDTFLTVTSPKGFNFEKSCLKDKQPIYNDSNRFTFFNLPQLVTEIPYIKTGNIAEKENPSLSWSIKSAVSANIYIFFRKIPNQVPPTWITKNYRKITPEGYVDLPQFMLRKNELGLIGVYDIYEKTNIPPGITYFYPAIDFTAPTAYSMYIVAVDPK